MFTWLQTHIQKHHKIIFGIILVVVIISFVFTIGNFGGFGQPAGPGDIKREFYGFNLNSNRDSTSLQQWSTISLELNRQRYDGQVLEYAVMQRAVKLYLAAELQIPEPTDAQFQDFVRSQPAFQNYRTGEFSQDYYTSFLDRFKNNSRVSEETLIITLAQDYRIAQVDAALSGPGYVLPYQAVEDIKRRDTTWSIEVAEMPRETFQPNIELSDENLEEFFNLNKLAYETDPKLTVNFVQFEAADFMDQVPEPTQDQLTTLYNQQRAKWPKNDEGATVPMAEIEDVVAAEWKTAEAKKLALQAASDLGVDLYDAIYAEKVKRGDDTLAAYLTSQGLTLETLPAYSKSELPTGTPIPAAALQQALTLNDKRFYTDGLATDNGAAILFLQDKSGTTIPAFAEVRERVVADYSASEEERQFNQKGIDSEKALQAAVEEGESFSEAATALGLAVESFDDFKVGSKPEGVDNFILQTMENMNVGEVQSLVGSGDISTIIYVEKRDIPEVASDSEEVISQLESLTPTAARATQASIVNELIAVGLDKLEAQDETL